MIVLGALLSITSAPAFAVLGHARLSFSPFGSFARATRLAIDQANGNVFVADSNSNNVRVFNAEGGTPTGGIPSELTGVQTPAGSFANSGEYLAPGIAVDNACQQQGLTGAACASFDSSNGNIYVSDLEHNVVDKFRVNGSNEYEYVCQFTGFGFVGSACLKNEPSVQATPTEVTFSRPDGVAVDREGDVYISDHQSQAIYEYNSKDEDERKIQFDEVGVLGGIGVPEHPGDVALDSTGNMYVMGSEGESGLYKLKRGSFTGVIESSEAWIRNPAEPHPFGLAFDQIGGLLFVATEDYSDDHFLVSEYDQSGEVLSSFDPESLGISVNIRRGIAVNETTGEKASGNVYVVSADGKSVDVFTSLVLLASATTGGVVSDGRTSAPVEGTVNPESKTIEAGCEVEYGTTTAYGSKVPCSPASVGTGETPVPATAVLSGLLASTVYHYRVVATNANGANPGPDASFETLPSVEGVVTGEARELSQTSALLTGSLKPNGVDAHYYFQYGETTAYGSTVPVPPGDDAGTVAEKHAEVPVEGLTANTAYHYRLVATNELGTTYGGDEVLVTLPNEPVVMSETASGIFPQSALLSAIVNPETANTTYHFIYGLTEAYGSSAPASDLTLGTGTQGLQALFTIEGLQPDTTYHYAIVATNHGGSRIGPDRTFTTSIAALPEVVTGVPVEVSANSATLTGSVNPEGVPTVYEFDLGTDTTYGSRVFGEAGSSSVPVGVSVGVQGLQAGTAYHYRLVASNVYGTVYGADQTLITPGFPTALLIAPTVSPLIATPAFTPPSIAGAITVGGKVPKAKPKTKTKAKRRKARKAAPAHAKKGSRR
ncbi:MAG: hypothetical protein WA484_07145 [Solirubrobacteraceae bacterium]